MGDPFPNYVYPPAGGSIIGATAASGESGFATKYIESAWGASFLFYILYLVFIFLEPVFQSNLALHARRSLFTPVVRTPIHTSSTSAAAAAGSATAATPEAVAAVIEASLAPPPSIPLIICIRLIGVGNASRDSFLILLSTTLVSEAGYGISNVSWI
ncbi:hypothetical protein BASA83_009062 [Batrachochytrium salamandrivorans]|nr:hypothetical protein BASA83_009062 [Batrachochytrium salamandrivorans]